MTQARTVSIILPTYNRAERLRPCVQSVFDQTFQDWELLICDDASRDNTESIAEQLAQIDARVAYFKNDLTPGLPGNRNFGISKAASELILFIEDDVILEPDCVSLLVDTYERYGKQLKIGAIAPSRPDEWLADSNTKASVLDYAWRGANARMGVPCTLSSFTGVVRYNFVPAFSEMQEVPCVHACSLYPKKVLEDVGGYDSQTYTGNYLYEETDLNIRLRKRGYKFFHQPKAVMHHQPVHEGGCRTDTMRYAYFFVLNHTRYLLKNFGLRSVWMVPSFLLSAGLVAFRAVVAYAISKSSARPFGI